VTSLPILIEKECASVTLPFLINLFLFLSKDLMSGIIYSGIIYFGVFSGMVILWWGMWRLINVCVIKESLVSQVNISTFQNTTPIIFTKFSRKSISVMFTQIVEGDFAPRRGVGALLEALQFMSSARWSVCKHDWQHNTGLRLAYW